MANFYNSKQQSVNFAYDFPCDYEDIYILNLKEDEILISYDPSFMQNTNGMIIGIDSRFTDFYIIDRNQNVIKSLKLEWINNCTINQAHFDQKNNFFYPILSMILLILIIILVVYKIKRRKNENN